MASSAAARAIFISRTAADSSLKSTSLPLLIRPFLIASSNKKRAAVTVKCLISGVDGGGVSDEFVSTRKSSFRREFSVLANMLKTIEPLDNSVISKGVSDSAKDSMKQTISTMLGLLPSDQFSVTVRVLKKPLDHLIVSSIVTGYTLWNAEYRMSLMRNFHISPEMTRSLDFSGISGVPEVLKESGDGVEECVEGFGRMNLQKYGDLSSEALDYIQHLESELSTMKQELHACKEENLQMEHIKRNNNNLLEYLRSLESDMVTELSKPSSPEVEEIIHHLAENTLQMFFKEDKGFKQLDPESDNEFSDIVDTSRDYLAKLLFWCMLLGHHLRGLENRLHLSCAVGLL